VKGTAEYFNLKQGTLRFSPSSGASWETNKQGEDFRLYNAISNEALSEVIEELMIKQPAQ
jgi:hypothetical protein